MATYTGKLGETHSYPGIARYLGKLGETHELPRLWLGVLGAQPALWATVHQGVLGAAPRLNGEPLDPPAEQQTLYHAYLTGGPDGLPDLELTATSFQFTASLFIDIQEASLDRIVFVNGILWFTETTPRRVIRGFDHRVQLTVPGVEQAPGVRARPNGELVLERERFLLDGSSQLRELYRGPFQDLETQRGARKSSMQLWGSAKETDLPERQGVRIRDIFYIATDEEDRLRFRAAPINELRPGDQVEIDGETREVKEIQFRVGPAEFTMEVQCGVVVA